MPNPNEDTRILPAVGQVRIFCLDPSSSISGWALLLTNEAFQEPRLARHGTLQVAKDDYHGALETRMDGLLQAVKPELAIFEKPGTRFRAMRIESYHRYCNAVSRYEKVLRDYLGSENVYSVYPQTWKASVKKYITIRKCNIIFGTKFNEQKTDKGEDDQADAIMLGAWFCERMRVHPIPNSSLCTF